MAFDALNIVNLNEKLQTLDKEQFVDMMQQQPKIKPTIKAITLGDAFVGKTSLVTRLLTGVFVQTRSTVGIEFQYAANLQVYDTAGVEEHACLFADYMRNVDLAFLVYDGTSETSLYNLKYVWIPKLMELYTTDPPKLMMVRNKVDLLLGGEEQAQWDNGREYAKRLGAGFFSVSSKTGYGIDLLRGYLYGSATTLTQIKQQELEQQQQHDDDDICVLEEEKEEKTQKKKKRIPWYYRCTLF